MLDPIKTFQYHNPFSPENPLFRLARTGKLRMSERLYPYIAAIVSTLTPILSGLVLTVPLVLLLMIIYPGVPYKDLLYGNIYRETLSLIAGFLPTYFFVWLWLRIFEKRSLPTTGLSKTGAIRKYGRGSLLGLLMFVACLGIIAAAGYVQVEQNSSSVQGAAALGGVTLIFTGWMIQGAAEELVLRGYLLPVLGSRLGAIPGILFTSGLFAAYHLYNRAPVIGILNIFLFGVFTAIYALWEGGLWGVFAFHSVWNWVQGNFFGFEVSGTTPSTAMLVDLQLNGPAWFTGGAFGPEGGLAVTVVLVLSILVLLALVRRTNRSDFPATLD